MLLSSPLSCWRHRASAPRSPKSRANLRSRRRKQFLLSRTRISSNRGINEATATNRGQMIVTWVATGACAAATMIVRAAATAKWVQTGECIAIVMGTGIATKNADDTENSGIATIEAGTARTGAETTGVTMKIDRAVA